MEEKKDLTLLVMAAGMGSRFGGLKQIEPIGPNNEFITDYSVYDAIQYGIKKVVFIIKKENLEIFENTIGKRMKDHIKIEYAFQEKTIKAEDKQYEREKPWGTAHAILAAKDKIDGNFIVINSDDFYGRESYEVATNYFSKPRGENEFALVGYHTKNTLTENGSAKRGICEVENNYLKRVIESKVERIDGRIIAKPLSNAPSFEVEEERIVSMNMFLFTPRIFTLIEEHLEEFITENRENLDTAEYLIPDLIQKAIDEKQITMEVLETTAKWEGVTYKEDKELVVAAITKMIQEGVYKENLWEKS